MAFCLLLVLAKVLCLASAATEDLDMPLMGKIHPKFGKTPGGAVPLPHNYFKRPFQPVFATPKPQDYRIRGMRAAAKPYHTARHKNIVNSDKKPVFHATADFKRTVHEKFNQAWAALHGQALHPKTYAPMHSMYHKQHSKPFHQKYKTFAHEARRKAAMKGVYKTSAHEARRKAHHQFAAEKLKAASHALKNAATALSRYGNDMNVFMDIRNLREWRANALGHWPHPGLPIPIGKRKYVVVPLPSTPAPHPDVCARGLTALCACEGKTIPGWQDGEGVQTCLGQTWGPCNCTATVCAPGATQQCTCTGDEWGVQVCQKGKKWGHCSCSHIGKHKDKKTFLVSQFMPTTQSGHIRNAVSSRAVDGHTSGKFNRKSCTQTASSVGAWWKVDLKKAFQIKSVVIWNRQDCCQNRLDQVTVSVCCSPPSLAFEACGRVAVASRKNTIRCNGVRGRYVQVMSHQPRQVKLTLCEVQVFGSECTDPDCKTPWTPSPTKPPCLDASISKMVDYFGDGSSCEEAAASGQCEKNGGRNHVQKMCCKSCKRARNYGINYAAGKAFESRAKKAKSMLNKLRRKMSK